MIDYELFFNYSLDMFVIAGLDGYLKRANPAFCKMLGYSENELLARPYLEIIHPDDAEKVIGAVKNLTSGHPAFLVQVRMLSADGRYFPLEWTAYPDLNAGLLFAIARDYNLSYFDSQQLRMLIDSSPTAVFLINQAGIITYSNHLAELIFEYTCKELIGKPIEILVPDKYRSRHTKHRHSYTQSPTLRPMGVLPNLVGRRQSGEEFPIDVGLNPVRLHQGDIIICSVIDTSIKNDFLNTLLQEKSKLERENTRLEHLADHDTLTEIYNRRAFERILLHNLSDAREYGETISIMLADIDRFKQYNDSFGHQAGDMVLKHLGQMMSVNVRKEDTVARFGGEEFVVVLPGIDYHQSIQFGERLRKIIEQDSSALHPVTISLGAATYHFHSSRTTLGRVKNQLIAEADKAMYHSKSTGRNRVTHFEDLDQHRVK